MGDPRFEELFVPIALGVVVVLLVAVGLLSRRRARAAARAASRMGPGSALAHALDGDLSGARRILEDLVRLPGGRTPDVVVGLVAVLRQQSQWSLASELTERLAAESSVPWLTSIRVQLALDMGDSNRAIELVESDGGVPAPLAIAAYARAGRWGAAYTFYRKHTGRKVRDRETEANLLAGAAMEAKGAGDEKGGRKALKRARGLSETASLVGLAEALFDGPKAIPDPDIKARTPWLFNVEGGLVASGAEARATLDAAREEYAAGESERALGRLRDALEENPALHALRAQYADWILDVGEPSDWRAELSEVLEMLHQREPVRVRPSCTACGFHGEAAFAVCPRCNAIGTVTARVGTGPDAGGSTDMSVQAAVARFWGLTDARTGVDSAKL